MNLSNMWFIYSLNYTELIDKTLADRIPIIHIDGYNTNQKLEMSKRHLIPTAIKNVHLDKKDISFSDDALTYIITETNKMYSETTKDKNGNSGVRKLKDAISNVITKINFLKNIILEDGTYGDLNISFAIKDFKLPFVVERKHIDTLKVLSKKESIDPPMNMYM
jgi:ATP-dependent Lon protease